MEYYNKENDSPFEPYLLEYDMYLKQDDQGLILLLPNIHASGDLDDVFETMLLEYTVDISETSQSTFSITVNNKMPKVEIPVEKVWEDADNQDGKRPTEITVKLLAGGNDTGKILVLNADNEWKGSFTNLDKFAEGEEIVYTIEEVEVTDYTSAITGTVAEGFTITNSYTPETIEIPVEKVWEDADNQDGKRPTEITVKLLAGGNDTGKILVLNADNEWKGSFTKLDKFANGEEIVYTVEEVKVEGYKTSISGDVRSGFVIKNYYSDITKTGETSHQTLIAGLLFSLASIVFIYKERKYGKKQ